MIGEQTFEGRRENLAKRTSFRGPTPRFWKPSIDIVAKANRKLRSNTSMSMKAVRPLSAMWRGDATYEASICGIHQGQRSFRPH
jgi:hypothetical protein